MVNKMADIFLMVGIIVSVTLSDALVCLVLTAIIEHVEKALDDDLYLLPSLLVNSIAFVLVTASIILEKIAR